MKNKNFLCRGALFYVVLLNVLFPIVSNSAEKVYFYHTDPAGTPLAMTDSIGSVVWRADYKPFGEENTVASNIDNNKEFVGKEKDDESGLYYFGARYMNPKTGRFTAVDPVRAVDPRTSKTNEKLLLNPQNLNPYAYSLNNPYRYVDPDGNTVWDIMDFAFFGHSAYKFAKDPSWSNAGDLALDTVGLLPMVPSIGSVKMVGKGIEAIEDASKAARAESGADAVRLKKSLASEQQMTESGIPIAGTGTGVPFRDANRIATQYGGEAGDWRKMTSTSYTAPDGKRFETHWVENSKTGQRVEFKTKFP
jgi:RHS repeat-associated protein